MKIIQTDKPVKGRWFALVGTAKEIKKYIGEQKGKTACSEQTA
ncbi:hypothetical protein ABE137_11875 [Brevibacillus laterosporus]|uniref:Uncharacterized protein n=1 Tax=Brevibacillus halotolerans TaxID=1507437 RepID=A0ABT4HYA3_9BACL|nr:MULTISPECIES: hypothetical protein [Brevibacillus]MCR8986043.1 hypothetical protein [Brevibacillus laterosporus]MCR8987898.1 hypothetical protein [Brevibacillus laterosporus]MCZ0831776.1 hypothetical protein [Brevibacillus halotolerans]MCZ0833637.1 hypothetical protein [Brevibacillus halotolerans]